MKIGVVQGSSLGKITEHLLPGASDVDVSFDELVDLEFNAKEPVGPVG